MVVFRYGNRSNCVLLVGFHRPFDKTDDGKEIPLHLEDDEENGELVENEIQNAASVAQATTASINTVVEDIARQTIPSADKIAAAVVNQQSQIIANAEQQTPEMVEAQTNYVDALKNLTENVRKSERPKPTFNS